MFVLKRQYCISSPVVHCSLLHHVTVCAPISPSIMDVVVLSCPSVVLPLIYNCCLWVFSSSLWTDWRKNTTASLYLDLILNFFYLSAHWLLSIISHYRLLHSHNLSLSLSYCSCSSVSSWFILTVHVITPEWRKLLHLSARGVTTDPGSISGCITTDRDWESHRVAHIWPSIVRVRLSL